jgi:hypothetical protein
MTTKVTIEVPESADYVVQVITLSDPDVLPSPQTMYVMPGERRDVYIHGSMQIAGIQEISKIPDGIHNGKVYSNGAVIGEQG